MNKISVLLFWLIMVSGEAMSANIVANIEIDLGSETTTEERFGINRELPISIGPQTVSIGDTIQLNFSFANGQLLQVNAGNGITRFRSAFALRGTSGTTNVMATISFINLSGDPINNPVARENGLTIGSNVTNLGASFADQITGFNPGESIQFSGLHYTFTVTELSVNPTTFDRFAFSIQHTGGSFTVVPEPLSASFFILGIVAALSRRRRNESNRQHRFSLSH